MSNNDISRVKYFRDIIGQFDNLNSIINLFDPIFEQPKKISGEIGEVILAHEWTHYFQYLATSAGVYISNNRRHIFNFEFNLTKLLLDKKKFYLPLSAISHEALKNKISDLIIEHSALINKDQHLFFDWDALISKLSFFETEFNDALFKGKNPIKLNKTGAFGIFLKNKGLHTFPVSVYQIFEFMAFSVSYRLALDLDIPENDIVKYLSPYSILRFTYNAPILFLYQSNISDSFKNAMDLILFDLMYGKEMMKENTQIVIFASILTLMISWHPASVWRTRGGLSPSFIFSSLLFEISSDFEEFKNNTENGISLLKYADMITAKLDLPIFTRCVQESIDFLKLEFDISKHQHNNIDFLSEPKWVKEWRVKAHEMILDDGLLLIYPLRCRNKLPTPNIIVHGPNNVFELKFQDEIKTYDIKDAFILWRINHVLGKLLYDNNLYCFTSEKPSFSLHNCPNFKKCCSKFHRVKKKHNTKNKDLKYFLKNCSDKYWKKFVEDFISDIKT